MENKDFFESIVNKVIQGDCLEVMKKIPNNSVDVTFADPPFNLKKKYNSYLKNMIMLKFRTEL